MKWSQELRRDEKTGVIYPRLIIYKVTARYNGKIVFKANWFSGVSPNPYLAFYFKAENLDLIEVEWEDDYSKSTFKRGYLKFWIKMEMKYYLLIISI